jgi:putative ABC transport system permease protein
LVEGRALDEGDGAPRARSVVVSESFARQYWPDGSALGRRVGGNPDAEETDAGWYEIVGVARDVHWWDLAGEPQHVVFYPLVVGSRDDPAINRAPEVVIRTAGDPLAQVSVLRQELRALNPRIPMDDPRTLGQVIDGATARLSFTMIMLGAASGVALLLGLVGIYGVISYVVAQRTREIGVRMALGATSGAVRSMVVRQSMALVGGGVLLGLITARLMSGALESMLYGVGQGDVLTYATVALALVTVAAAASWVPARRAAGLDPSLALRAE